jgi:Uma2 family endonuclease
MARHYTCEDYCSWSDDERIELINGVPFLMSPAPNANHNRVSNSLRKQLEAQVDGDECEVYSDTLDVFLAADTVVRPDILVVCDAAGLRLDGYHGAPLLIIEVLSPSHKSHDTVRKLELYKKARVQEYWMVDVEEQFVYVNLLDADGEYKSYTYYFKDTIIVTVLAKCRLTLDNVKLL